MQVDDLGNTVAQTQTGQPGAADVNIASGSVGIDPSQNVVSMGRPSAIGDAVIAIGGTAQYLFGGVVPPNGYAIYNPDATNDLWSSDSQVAAANGLGCIRSASNGGGYETPAGYKPVGKVSIVGAVTSQKITARWW